MKTLNIVTLVIALAACAYSGWNYHRTVQLVSMPFIYEPEQTGVTFSDVENTETGVTLKDVED